MKRGGVFPYLYKPADIRYVELVPTPVTYGMLELYPLLGSPVFWR
jgi:hypothetical protein